MPEPSEKKTKKNTTRSKKKLVIVKENEIIQNFKKNGISMLENLSETELVTVLKEADKKYYNNNMNATNNNDCPALLSDNEYDIIKEFVETKYPTNQEIHLVGASVERNKVTLPYFMGSMDKIKPDTDALSSWKKKFTGTGTDGYLLSCKLDGVSGLYTTEGPVAKLYTRGDGKVGQDISHLIPYLLLPKKKGVVIRGEFIIPKKIFEIKYSGIFANPRNMVAGMINHKTVNELYIKDLHFVVYEVIQPIMKPLEQMAFLEKLDIERVMYKSVSSTGLSNELLSGLLIDWRQNYTYEIDGVIVMDNKIYERKVGNPEHAFAFKMVLSDQVAEVKVVDVIWTPSKDGYLKPRVQVEPIQLGGVKIEYATGFNGAFIEQNKIGVGALIEIIRSGDVIPYIRKVVVPAENTKMPLVSYKWNETHVDIILENMDCDETVREKNITGFFRGIGVEGLSSGNILRLIEAGFDSVSKILRMTVNDFLKVEGFQMKMALKIFEGIREKVEGASLVTLMSASNMLGRGFSEKKMELIMESYPDVLVSLDTDMNKVERICLIKGMAKKSAETFVERISCFVDFMKEIGLEYRLSLTTSEKNKKDKIDSSHPLFGKTVVLTGTRDKVVIELLDKVGAKQGSTVSKNTHLVIRKSKEDNTSKVEDAIKLNIPVLVVEEFLGKYKCK